MIILLMVISDYFINGYWWLMIILLMIISDYFINGY
jgi:hypothetical protein